VFLDRDGTVMEEAGYCRDPQQVRLLAGAREAIVALRAAGYGIVIVTNQSGIGRGWITEAEYQAVRQEFERQLGPGLIDATYYCPDSPSAGPSACRKPAPGMLLQAAHDLDLDLARCWMVGDKASDIEAGRAAGTRTALVETGYGRESAAAGVTADLHAADLREVAQYLAAQPA
jgi:D-glycero-D-manno-heptose 1,7-bisphosphate phosphatase